MSSESPLKQILLRVKRRADEEKSVPNKRFKFVATCDSPKDDDIYRLLAKTKPLPQTNDYNTIQIKDFEDWSLNETKESKNIITCNGQPLDSVENKLEDSLDYIYDIYVVDNLLEQTLNDGEYREYEDSEEDSNDENYAYNDYPDDNEVSEDVIDYYSYRDDHNDSQHDLRDDFERSKISSDYDLSDEDVDQIDRYFLNNRQFPTEHLNNEED